jgi:hypothetical protein
MNGHRIGDHSRVIYNAEGAHFPYLYIGRTRPEFRIVIFYNVDT